MEKNATSALLEHLAAVPDPRIARPVERKSRRYKTSSGVVASLVGKL